MKPELIFVLCLTAIQASAQVAPLPSAVVPAPGTFVRVWRLDRSVSSRATAGRLIVLTADSIVLEGSRLGHPLVLGLDSVKRLEFSAGRGGSTQHAVIGAAIGGILGSGLGVAMSQPFSRSNCQPPGCRRLERMDVALGLLMALPAAFLGGVIGVQIPGKHIWQSVSLDRHR